MQSEKMGVWVDFLCDGRLLLLQPFFQAVP